MTYTVTGPTRAAMFQLLVNSGLAGRDNGEAYIWGFADGEFRWEITFHSSTSATIKSDLPMVFDAPEGVTVTEAA